MKGKSYKLEAREKAFSAYRSCGGNVEAALREMEKEGYKISKPTFYEWMEKFNFKERLKNADKICREAEDLRKHYREKMLIDLKTQKERYDAYFQSIQPQVDNQATYAYTSICTTISNLQKMLEEKPQIDRPALFLEFMRDLVSFYKEHDPAALPTLEDNFDEFITFAKAKYAQGN